LIFDGSHFTEEPRSSPIHPRFYATLRRCAILRLSGRTLEKHRIHGTGPKYREIGGRVICAIDDLNAWADLGVKRSTSGPISERSFRQKSGATPSVPLSTPPRRS
jgi:hypothetical protein